MGGFERGHGLVIGVSEYDDPTWNVQIADRDAGDIHAALIDPQVGAYDRGRVKLLLGSQATRDRIGVELRVLSEQAEPGDTVFISFTGHGAIGDDNLYYLASSDTAFSADQRQIRKDSGYSIARLASALRAIRAERLLVVINACASGHLGALAVKDGLRSTVIPESGGNDLLASGRGRALITASRPDERSYFQSADSNSYFGRALVSGLQGVGVSPASGYVGLFELYGAIFTQVQSAARAAGVVQHPRLNLVDGEGPFPVARYPGKAQGDPSKIDQAPPAGTDVQMVQITIDNRRIGTNIEHSQTGDINIGDAAGGSINDMHLPIVTNIDSLIERILPMTHLPQIVIPPIIVTPTDPPPIDPGPRPDTGGGPLIHFGVGTHIDNLTFKGDIVQGNMLKNVYNQGGAEDDRQHDPLSELQKIRGRVEGALNVDEDARDDAANKIKQAHRALDQGDSAKAAQRIDEALEILDAMSNGYINGLTRKLRAVRDTL